MTEQERQAKMLLLKSAEAAYHDLMTGRSARVIVDQNSERVEFTAANRSALGLYITQLKAELGLLSPAPGVMGGPMGFIF